MKKASIFLLYLCLFIPLWGQQELHLTLLNDQGGRGAGFLETEIRNEIKALLGPRYTLQMNTQMVDMQHPDLTQTIANSYQDQNTDIIIGIGFDICSYLGSQTDFPKPTLLTTVLDIELHRIPLSEAGTSGVRNLTYMESPFDVERDLKKLYEIKPFDQLAIVGMEVAAQNDFDPFMQQVLAFSGAAFQLINAESTAEASLQKIGEEVDAVYLFPVFDRMSNEEVKVFLDGLAERGLPVFSLVSSPLLTLGAYAAYETDDNLQRMARRSALQLMKLAEGQPAENLPVKMDNFTENLVINLQTARKTGYYPDWSVLADAILINITSSDSDRKLTMKSAIAEGLQNNLQVKIAEKDTRLSEKDVSIARSNLWPQIEANTTLLGLDELTVRNSFGTRGQLNWTASATLTQVILSEPAYANIAIQKFLLESKRMVLAQNELDIVLDVSQAYLNILRSVELFKLRNENVGVTRKNYDIAQAKEQVGYSGTSDVYRWESELALDNVDLNTAQAQLRQAQFSLNNLLNRPISEEFNLADIALSDSILLIFDERLTHYINNPGIIELFADFMVDEAFRNLPEIRQLNAAVDVQERSLKSQNRAFVLPSLVLQGQYDYPIGNYYYPEGVNPIPLQPTYNAAAVLQVPIFQGRSRLHQQQQTKIGLLQLQDQMKDLRNLLELQVRANLETAGASFSNMELSRQSAEAAQKNFEIIQNSYRQGLVNVTSLIDAQNAALSAKINATNAAYTFISDFLAVERAVGYFHFLAVEESQQAFLERFINFIENKSNE